MIKRLFRYLKMLIAKKEITKYLLLNNYLNKYNYYLEENTILDTPKTQEQTNYIWQLWLQGEENAPPIVKKCLNSIKTNHPEMKNIVLNKDTIKQYLDIPKCIEKKYKQGIISNTHFSDYIRTCLLYKYGGIWIDSTVLLTDKIPENILKQNFFVFKNPLWYSSKIVPSEELFKVFLSMDRNAGLFGSSWFIIAKKNNPILKLQKQLLENYWAKENKNIHYFFFHFLLTKSLIKNPICKKIYEDMYSLSNKEPHILQNALDLKYNENLFNEIKKLSFIHKLTYKKETIEKNSFFDYLLNEDII